MESNEGDELVSFDTIIEKRAIRGLGGLVEESGRGGRDSERARLASS